MMELMPLKIKALLIGYICVLPKVPITFVQDVFYTVSTIAV